MPGEYLEDDAFERLAHLASTVTDHELLNTKPAQLLRLLFNEDSVRLFDADLLQFGCKCSRKRVAGVLKSLGQPEMDSVLDERGMVEVSCEYCGKDYQFDRVDVASMFSDLSVKLEPPTGVH